MLYIWRQGSLVFRRLTRGNLRFARRQIRKARRLTLRNPGRDFTRAAYLEVHTVLRYVYLFLPIVFIPFVIYDIVAHIFKWNAEPRMIYFDAGVYIILGVMNVVFSGARLRTLSLTQLRWLCTTGVLMLSLCGTVATVVLFNQAQDLSMFSGTLLAIAVLFRFPDWTKFGVYALNYAILYTFLYSRGITNPVLLQNPMFVLFMIVLFDRVTFFSMSSNYFKSRRLQQLNEWMVQEDRNKSEMISIAIHDLKSPVTGIMSVSKLLRDSPGGFAPGERDEILSEIQESSRAILGRIEDLVDIAQSGAGTVLHYESFNLLEVLYGTIQNFNYQASLKRIEVYTRFPEGPLIVRADRRAVIRIFENLVSNAIKYSPPDGSVLLQSRSTAGAGRVMVDVCDEGPGFTLEDRSRIFGRFTRLSARPTAGESSTGIGLFTVYKLVQQMENVTLELDSESGAGARFSVTLPLA